MARRKKIENGILNLALTVPTTTQQGKNDYMRLHRKWERLPPFKRQKLVEKAQVFIDDFVFEVDDYFKRLVREFG
jgi:hypothetical protein